MEDINVPVCPTTPTKPIPKPTGAAMAPPGHNDNRVVRWDREAMAKVTDEAMANLSNDLKNCKTQADFNKTLVPADLITELQKEVDDHF